MISLKSISELGDNETKLSFKCDKGGTVAETTRFRIPSFQRGYRWTELQVQQLVEDLISFHKDPMRAPNDWYCLQPLVVVKGTDDEEQGKWIVIDGQQRLTSLFLLVKALGGNVGYSIEYETRKCSGDFLNQIENKTEDEARGNPDFYCIFYAWNTIQALLERGGLKTEELLDTICKNAKVIWYETTCNPYEEFSRLNSGKISLSNAELMKALLLKEPLVDDKKELAQLEASKEWDMIEHSLRDDDFWCFINPEPNHRRFAATRIDFLFEMVLRRKETESANDISYELEKNPYFIFGYFQELCNTDGAATIWHDVQAVFRYIRSWYEDRELFHRVGYLMNRKGRDVKRKLSDLAQWLNDAESKTKGELRDGFNREVIGSIKTPICNLTYGEDNVHLNNILLLFNIAIMLRQRQEKSRYPFREHKTAFWTLEHIHAKEERVITGEDMKRIAKLLGITISDKDESECAQAINKRLAEGGEKDAEGEFIPRLEGKDGAWKLIDNKDTHGLENLALLGHRANSTFNNSLYLEKRAILSDWEKCNREELERVGFDKVEFVPAATRMVFFKQFSPEVTYPFLWTEQDANNYMDAIVKTLHSTFGFDEMVLRGEKTVK